MKTKLRIREEKKFCVVTTMNVFIIIAFLFLIGVCVGVLTSFDASANADYNWSRLIFSSIVVLTVGGLIVLWTHVIKIMLSPSDEE